MQGYNVTILKTFVWPLHSKYSRNDNKLYHIYDGKRTFYSTLASQQLLTIRFYAMNDITLNTYKISNCVREYKKKNSDEAYTSEHINVFRSRIDFVHTLQLIHLKELENVYQCKVYESSKEEYHYIYTRDKSALNNNWSIFHTCLKRFFTNHTHVLCW